MQLIVQVLKPGSLFILFEHGPAPDQNIGRRQDRVSD